MAIDLLEATMYEVHYIFNPGYLMPKLLLFFMNLLINCNKQAISHYAAYVPFNVRVCSHF